jgi:MFS-type transporter involved in bile tolerance (Atg22 family)
MFLGPITVTYIADYTGDLTVTFAPFLAPAILVFVVGVLMVWAKDPARRRRIEEYAGE